MNNCSRCGLIQGLHFSVLPACKCQWQGTPNTDYQKKWVGLTDEEIDKIRNTLTLMSAEGRANFSIYTYARAIEAKLKEKNT
jgi:hypothetical protein